MLVAVVAVLVVLVVLLVLLLRLGTVEREGAKEVMVRDVDMLGRG